MLGICIKMGYLAAEMCKNRWLNIIREVWKGIYSLSLDLRISWWIRLRLWRRSIRIIIRWLRDGLILLCTRRIQYRIEIYNSSNSMIHPLRCLILSLLTLLNRKHRHCIIWGWCMRMGLECRKIRRRHLTIIVKVIIWDIYPAKIRLEIAITRGLELNKIKKWLLDATRKLQKLKTLMPWLI